MKKINDRAKETVRQMIRTQMIQGAVIGCSDSEEIFADGFQTVHPKETPMTRYSRFDIASTGKIFTAGCAALLICQGKLDPDAPFTKYLPEHVLGKDCDITVRDLAMHCSGFDNSKPYESPDPVVLQRELMKKLPVRKRLEAYEYACSNMILLGKIVERLTGLDLDAAARKLLWDPLKMTRTTWNPPGDGPDEVEHWFPNRPAGQHNDPVCFYAGVPLGSGSCFSTVDDMALFAKDVLARRAFPEEYYDLITTCKYEKNGARRSFGWDMSQFGGLFSGGKLAPKCASPAAIWHTGWTGQTIFVDPEKQRYALVMTSRTSGDWDASTGMRSQIVDDMFAE